MFCIPFLVWLSLADLPVLIAKPSDVKTIKLPPYNDTYPLTPAVTINGKKKYRIAVISDNDKSSKTNDNITWMSVFRRGWLTYDPAKKKVEVTFDDVDKDSKLVYGLSFKGRGMELSDLVTFNGSLYTCDDRTGEIYELTHNDTKVLPFVHLNDGDGRDNKGYKCEWLSVKDGKLYMGSTGKEWTDKNGSYVNGNPEWIKVVNVLGVVENVDWSKNYQALRNKTGHQFPGYFMHESAVWSKVHKKWFFLPRRASKKPYDSKEDEKRCSNLMLTADENFENIAMRKIGKLDTNFGFSAFRFIPDTGDEAFVALKTKEIDDEMESILVAYSIKGRRLLKEHVKLGNQKFEGIEFI